MNCALLTFCQYTVYADDIWYKTLQKNIISRPIHTATMEINELKKIFPSMLSIIYPFFFLLDVSGGFSLRAQYTFC